MFLAHLLKIMIYHLLLMKPKLQSHFLSHLPGHVNLLFSLMHLNYLAYLVEYQELYYDEMFALVPQSHVLANYEVLSMKQIAKYPFIQLDEGEYSLPIKTFQNLGLHVQIKHKVYDDFTILAMIRQNLGISILYQNALSDYDDLCLIPIQENLFRHVGIAYNNYDTLSYAGKTFLDFILRKTPEILKNKDSFHII